MKRLYSYFSPIALTLLLAGSAFSVRAEETGSPHEKAMLVACEYFRDKKLSWAEFGNVVYTAITKEIDFRKNKLRQDVTCHEKIQGALDQARHLTGGIAVGTAITQFENEPCVSQQVKKIFESLKKEGLLAGLAFINDRIGAKRSYSTDDVCYKKIMQEVVSRVKKGEL